MRKWIVLWLASLLFVAVTASTLTTFAQGPRIQPGAVITGGDFGFRFDGIDPWTRRPSGKIVVRVDDEWVEVAFATTPRRVD